MFLKRAKYHHATILARGVITRIRQKMMHLSDVMATMRAAASAASCSHFLSITVYLLPQIIELFQHLPARQARVPCCLVHQPMLALKLRLQGLDLSVLSLCGCMVCLCVFLCVYMCADSCMRVRVQGGGPLRTFALRSEKSTVFSLSRYSRSDCSRAVFNNETPFPLFSTRCKHAQYHVWVDAWQTSSSSSRSVNLHK